MTRLRDWQSKLAALIDERRDAPFSWGTNDCCIFAADAVLAQTGHDPAEGLREHRDAKEAAGVLRAGGGVQKIASERFGAEIAPALAGVGDVGLIEVDRDRPALAIWGGAAWLAPAEDGRGLVSLPRETAKTAWRAF